MTLDKTDEGKIKKIVMTTVVDALEQVVLPRIQATDDRMEKGFARVDKEIGYVKEEVGSMKEDIGSIKGDIEIIKEDISDLQDSSNRIETLVKSEIKYVDNLSGRVLKLETKKV